MSLSSGKALAKEKIRQRIYDWKRSKYIHLFPHQDPDPYELNKDLIKADRDNNEEATIIATIITEEIFNWFLAAKKEIVIGPHTTLHEGVPWVEISQPVSAGIDWGS